jgi:uncharacterized protein (UPF0210 family)
MIDREHLDIRTITMGISCGTARTATEARRAPKIYDKICRCAEHLVPVGQPD